MNNIIKEDLEERIKYLKSEIIDYKKIDQKRGLTGGEQYTKDKCEEKLEFLNKLYDAFYN